MLSKLPAPKSLPLLLILAAGAVGGPPASARGPVAAEPSALDTLLGWSVDLSPTATDATAPALRDRVVIVSFVSTACTIACIVRTRDLDGVARTLPRGLRERVAFLTVSTDPARDDAARLRAFAGSLVGADSPLRFRTSDEAGTAALAARLHYPAASLPEPPPTILAFDRRGQIAMTYGTDPVDGARLLRDAALLDTFDQGIGRPASGRPVASSAPF